jgi:hypothetical protein
MNDAKPVKNSQYKINTVKLKPFVRVISFTRVVVMVVMIGLSPKQNIYR